VNGNIACNVNVNMDYSIEWILLNNPELVEKLGSAFYDTIKLVEEALTFIPLWGDGYDVFRSFIYDGRLEIINAEIEKFALEIEGYFREEVFPTLFPSRTKIIGTLRKSFDPREAVFMLSKKM